MSTTIAKRSLTDATRDADALRELFAGTYAQWHVAGSVRRRVPYVSDVEHVVVPLVGRVPVDGDLFGSTVEANVLLRRADDLVAAGALAKHVYPDGRTRWGERYRGLSFRGFAHELFIADPDGSNLGPTLAIRTGPGEFSKRLVTALWGRGMRNHQGYVWRCEPCPCRSPERLAAGSVPDCGGTGLLPVERLGVPTERAYFGLCGVGWVEPEERR